MSPVSFDVSIRTCDIYGIYYFTTQPYTAATGSATTACYQQTLRPMPLSLLLMHHHTRGLEELHRAQKMEKRQMERDSRILPGRSDVFEQFSQQSIASLSPRGRRLAGLSIVDSEMCFYDSLLETSSSGAYARTWKVPEREQHKLNDEDQVRSLPGGKDKKWKVPTRPPQSRRCSFANGVRTMSHMDFKLHNK